MQTYAQPPAHYLQLSPGRAKWIIPGIMLGQAGQQVCLVVRGPCSWVPQALGVAADARLRWV